MYCILFGVDFIESKFGGGGMFTQRKVELFLLLLLLLLLLQKSVASSWSLFSLPVLRSEFFWVWAHFEHGFLRLIWPYV